MKLSLIAFALSSTMMISVFANTHTTLRPDEKAALAKEEAESSKIVSSSSNRMSESNKNRMILSSYKEIDEPSPIRKPVVGRRKVPTAEGKGQGGQSTNGSTSVAKDKAVSTITLKKSTSNKRYVASRLSPRDRRRKTRLSSSKKVSKH